MANFESDELVNLVPVQQPIKEYKLYVTNIPKELNQDGLKELFESYGNVIGILYPRNSTWAFVTYGTYQEAEYVIKELNETSPLYLGIRFAREDKRQTIPANVLRSHDSRYSNKTFPRSIGRGRPLAAENKRSSILPVGQYAPEDDLLYPVPTDAQTYNPYESADHYIHTNALWTRGITTISPDGKRHVSLGRGYTHYEIPEAPAELDNALKKAYQMRNGLYINAESKINTGIGKCKTCSTLTKKQCSRCQEFYCSRECQITDWPVHKTECQEIPALSEAMGSASIAKANIKQEVNPSDVPKTSGTFRQSSLLTAASASAYPTFSDPQINKNNDNCEAQKDRFNKHEEEAKVQHYAQMLNKKQSTTKEPYFPNRVEHDGAHNLLKNTPNQPKLSNASVSDEDVLDKCSEVEKSITFSNDNFLSKNTFTEVQITRKCSGNEFWVQKVRDIEKLCNMQLTLQEEICKAAVGIPQVGNLCAALHKNVWYRAVVKSLLPLEVHFIDYGNTEIVQPKHIRTLLVFRHILPYARKIRLCTETLPKNKNFNVNDKFLVKTLSVDSEKTIIVKVKNENEGNMNVNHTQFSKPSVTEEKHMPTNMNKDESKSPYAHQSVVSLLANKQKGMMQIHSTLGSDNYSVTLLPESLETDFQMLFDEFTNASHKLALNSSQEFRPRVGDLICGHRILNDDWIRGYVLKTNSPLRIAVIDEARTAAVKECLPCPPKFSKICAFGATLHVPSNTEKLEGKALPFEVTGVKKECVEVRLVDCNGVKGIIKAWTPLPEQLGIEYAELKSDTEVCLTSYRNPHILFARSLEHMDVEYYNKLMQKVTKSAKSAAVLKQPPIVGQIVISQYRDQNYYRAIVVKLKDEQAGISYVDFGNIEYTNWSQLKELPDNLKEMRSCIAKITLKDIPNNVAMTKEANNFLNSLVTSDTPLLCKFVGEPSTDGVYLKTANGESVNDKLKDLLTPSHQKNLKTEEDLTCFMLDELETANLGKVGDVVSAVVMCKMSDSDQYCMCPYDQELISHIMEVLPALINAHCKATQHYIPRENELCLALYENNWYRAVCVCRNQTPDTATVFFVDYGNVENVAHKNIRKMVKEFMSPCALVSICTIIDSSGQAERTPEEREKISKLLVYNQTVKIKILKDIAGGYYDIQLADNDTSI